LLIRSIPNNLFILALAQVNSIALNRILDPYFLH